LELGWEDVRQVLAAIDATPLEELELEVGGLRLQVRKRAPAPGDGRASPASGLNAPAVGVFRRRGLDGGLLFVAPGALVEAGEVRAVIEVFREIEPVRAPLALEVVAVLVADGDFVEYGQPLMLVRSPAFPCSVRPAKPPSESDETRPGR